MTAQPAKIPSFLFAFAATASSLAAMPAAASQHDLLPPGNAALPTRPLAALQQLLADKSALASPCSRLAQPHPQGCADRQASPLGGLDWIHQVVAGDDLADFATFGNAVSIDGNVAVVGSPQTNPLGDAVGPGAAYVYVRTAAGWTQAQKLDADDGVLGDNFGIAVAVQGDTILVGAYKAAIGDHDQQGAVYVFRPLAGAWTQTQKLSPDDADAGRLFGAWISLDGDHALVSTPAGMMGDDPGSAPVYALHRDAGQWAITQRLDADDYVAGDVFGYQTALHGTTAMIGAPGAAVDGNPAVGAVYAFHYADGSWSQGQKLGPSGVSDMSAFGWAVVFDGTTALFGAPFTTVGDNAMQGAAYLFDLDGDVWTQTQKLTQASGLEFDRLGSTLALSGHTAIVGTPWVTEVDGAPAFGAAWVYAGTAEDGFVQQATLLPTGDEVTAFAYVATMNGSTLLLGAPIDGTTSRGYAVFYSPDRVFANGFDGATP